jgi:hypothetical protein
MTGTPPRSRPREHARGGGSSRTRDRERGSLNPFVAAAQILLGVGLSCLIGMLGLLALAAVVILALYLAK